MGPRTFDKLALLISSIMSTVFSFVSIECFKAFVNTPFTSTYERSPVLIDGLKPYIKSEYVVSA